MTYKKIEINIEHIHIEYRNVFDVTVKFVSLIIMK